MTLFSRSLLAPLLVLVLWLAWFCLPPTRDALQSGWKMRFSPSATVSPPGDDRDNLISKAYAASGEGPRATAFQELSQRFPNDSTILSQIVTFRADELHLGQTRQPGPSNSPDPNWSVKLSAIKKPAPALLRSWFAVCARGAQVEPDNTFWDWMQIIGLLAARRDDEVWGVLQRARIKTGYDDHAFDVAQAQVRALRSVNGAVAPIPQINATAAVLFPHFALMREAARQLSDDASGLRLRGEPGGRLRAVEGMRDLVFLSRTMRRESKSSIGSLVGQAIEFIALRGGTYSPLLFVTPASGAPSAAPPAGGINSPKLGFGAPLSAYASHPRSVMRLAQLEGRSDIAAQLGAEWNALSAWRRAVKKYPLGNSMVGISGRDLWLASLGDVLGGVLVNGMPSLLLLALGATLLRQLVPAWRPSTQEIALSRGSWLGGASLGLVCVPILLSAMIAGFAIAWRTAGGNLWSIVWSQLFSGTSTSAFTPAAPPVWGQNLPAVALFLLALGCARAWENRRQGRKSLGARLHALFQEPDDGMARFDVSPLLSLVLIVTTLFLATVGTVGFLVVPALNSDYASVHDYAGFALLSLTLVLALPMLVQLRSSASRAFALALAARFAWSFLVVGTLVWGSVWLATAPERTRFNAGLDRYLSVGEFQLIRQQLGL